MAIVRRLLAILLLTVLGLPALPSAMALAQGDGMGLPACCRRLGAHHCGMAIGERMLPPGNAREAVWQAPFERCPYCPASEAVKHHDATFTPAAQTAFLGHSDSNILRVRQAQCCWRVARDGARQKRGPPAISLA